MIALVALMAGASAHIGDVIAGVDIFVAEGDGPLAVEATFGLLLPRDDGSYGWTCHEAVTSEESIFLPQYDRSSTGEWLAAVGDPAEGRDGQTLFHSPAGCAWNPVTGLGDAVVNFVRFDPADAGRAWAVTTTPEGGAVYLSTDGGRSWAVDLEPIADRDLQGVAIVDGEVYATGSDVAGLAAFAWHRDAEGTWTSAALPPLGDFEGVRTRVLAVTDDTVYINVDPFGSDVLFVADRALTTFTRTIEDEGEILDGAVFADGLWMPMDFGQRALLLSPDGTYAEADTVAAVGASVSADGTLVLASLAYIEGPLLATRSDDGTFAPQVYPDDIAGPLDCPAGTESADVCAPLWPELEPRLRGFDAPPVEDSGGMTTPPTDSGCGCVSSADPLVAGLVLPLSLLVGRRRIRRV